MSNENEKQTRTTSPVPITLEKFQSALPSHGREMAATILRIAEVVNLDPCILAAVIAKESDYGAALRDGCGDWVARGRRYAGLPGMRTFHDRSDVPPGWAIPDGPGPWAIPEDGLGWKRGLMQIDWGLYRQWIETFNWREPVVAIAFGASQLTQAFEVFAQHGIHDPRYGVAAYDAGLSLMLATMRPWLPYYDPNIVTGGRNYSVKVMELASAIRTNLEA